MLCQTRKAETIIGIQYLRAIAIIMVILQHFRNRLPSPDFYQLSFKYINYWTGVDIFLAISGYLMCSALIKSKSSHSSRSFVFVDFFRRRFLRLVPCLVFWCVICILLAYFLQPAWGFSPLNSLVTFYTSLFGYSNIHFYLCVSQGLSCDQMNGVTWSLSLEWQLYLLLSFVVIAFKREYLLYLLSCLFILSIFLPVSKNYNLTLGWWIRPQAFLLGAMIYLLKDKIILLKHRYHQVVVMVLILLIMLAPVWVDYHIRLTVIGTVAAAIFVLFLKDSELISQKSIFSYFFKWVGDRSYSIYLCHLPIMHATREILNKGLMNTSFYQNECLYFLVFISSLIIISNFSYRFIEIKFIEIYKKK
ncbi:acyltransferase family protein [Rosenbergiella australiborealis]|uniref:acyltransferase family protein n=1 Tax=Rosenbergiella australiborealis TaxID=1544696 RepID=UPI0023EDC0E8|nr:acyltransferase [Rosenbergiella australiborealis]